MYIFQRTDQPSSYLSAKRFTEEERKALETISTLYVGNLSFYTTEAQIYELFSRIGPLDQVIMGLDRFSKTPCGFCFVVYQQAEDARKCMRYISGLKLDERNIRVDLDPGFSPGRQYGRGKSGGQVRDEYREDYDASRGGYGRKFTTDARDYR